MENSGHMFTARESLRNSESVSTSSGPFARGLKTKQRPQWLSCPCAAHRRATTATFVPLVPKPDPNQPPSRSSPLARPSSSSDPLSTLDPNLDPSRAFINPEGSRERTRGVQSSTGRVDRKGRDGQIRRGGVDRDLFAVVVERLARGTALTGPLGRRKKYQRTSPDVELAPPSGSTCSQRSDLCSNARKR